MSLEKWRWGESVPLGVVRAVIGFLLVIALAAAVLSVSVGGMLVQGFQDPAHYATLALSVVVPVAALLAASVFARIIRPNGIPDGWRP